MTVSGGAHFAPQAGEPTTRWAPLASFAVCTFYVTLLFWLAVWVIVPALVMQWQPLVVTSGSMSPLIRVGDVVLVGDHDPDVTYDDGTVIAFRDVTRDDRVITHRVAGVNDNGHYLTKGDANQSNDSVPVDPDQVVGVGRLLVPMIGLPLTWLQSGSVPLFGAWLVATILACVVASKRPDDTDDTDVEGEDVVTREPELEPSLSRRQPGLLWSTGIRTARRIGRLADRLGVSAPAASRARTYGPLVATFVITVIFVDAPLTFSTGSAATFVLLVADPRGPELRVGRWMLALRRLLGRASVADGPRPAVLRPAVATLVVLAVAVVAVPRTAAAFTATTTNPGNSWEAGSLTSSPTNLRGTCQLSKGQRSVDLTWTRSPDAGVTGYRVEVATTAGGPYTLVATLPATAGSMSYQVTTLDNNVSYHFVVRAVVGSWSGPLSNEVAAHFLGSNCSVS